jgi:hypothetical protein
MTATKLNARTKATSYYKLALYTVAMAIQNLRDGWQDNGRDPEAKAEITAENAAEQAREILTDGETLSYSAADKRNLPKTIALLPTIAADLIFAQPIVIDALVDSSGNADVAPLHFYALYCPNLTGVALAESPPKAPESAPMTKLADACAAPDAWQTPPRTAFYTVCLVPKALAGETDRPIPAAEMHARESAASKLPIEEQAFVVAVEWQDANRAPYSYSIPLSLAHMRAIYTTRRLAWRYALAMERAADAHVARDWPTFNSAHEESTAIERAVYSHPNAPPRARVEDTPRGGFVSGD